MKVFTYSEARQQLSTVLDIARWEEVLIKRRGGETFSLTFKAASSSPFDVPAVKTAATTQDILDAIRESRSGKPSPFEAVAREAAEAGLTYEAEKRAD